MNCIKCGWTNNDILSGYLCQSCGSILSSEPSIILKNKGLLWENALSKEIPLKAFTITLKKVFLAPNVFFKQLTIANNIYASWLFALLCGGIGYTFLFLWSQILPEPAGSLYSDSASFLDDKNSTNLLFTPLIISMQLFFLVFLIFFQCKLARIQNVTFNSVFRLVAYSHAAMIFQIIPYLGTFCSVLFMLYLIITGMSHQFAISKMKAILTLILPFILLFTIIIMAMLFFMMGALAISNIAGSNIPFFN
jgi:hypothetical protein